MECGLVDNVSRIDFRTGLDQCQHGVRSDGRGPGPSRLRRVVEGRPPLDGTGVWVQDRLEKCPEDLRVLIVTGPVVKGCQAATVRSIHVRARRRQGPEKCRRMPHGVMNRAPSVGLFNVRIGTRPQQCRNSFFSAAQCASRWPPFVAFPYLPGSGQASRPQPENERLPRLRDSDDQGMVAAVRSSSWVPQRSNHFRRMSWVRRKFDGRREVPCHSPSKRTIAVGLFCAFSAW